MSKFGDAFAAARKAGKKEFTWNGKRYNTKLKEETTSLKPKARPDRSGKPKVDSTAPGKPSGDTVIKAAVVKGSGGGATKTAAAASKASAKDAKADRTAPKKPAYRDPKMPDISRGRNGAKGLIEQAKDTLRGSREASIARTNAAVKREADKLKLKRQGG